MGRGGGGAGRPLPGVGAKNKKQPGGEVHSTMVNAAPPAINTEALKTETSAAKTGGHGAQRKRGRAARQGG
jgi:hypothetical protein